MMLRTTTSIVLLLMAKLTFAQTWLELKEQGANYYLVKEAFDRQYSPERIKEISKELRKEVQNPSRVTDKFEKEMEGVVHFKRWSNWIEPRVRETGGRIEMVSNALTRAIAEQKREVANRAGANWTLIGPKTTPVSGGNGRVNAIRVHPTNTSTLFACAPAGGLFKSTTGGSSWTPISDAIAVLGATDVAFDPANPNTMYLVTGDGEAGDASSTGVYKSIDGGTTWTITGLSFANSSRRLLSKILVNPTNGAIIVGGSAGIYRSTDAGATWTQTSTKSVRDLEFQPNNPSVVFAGGYSTTGFMRSADGGATWTTITSIPTTGIMRVAVAVTSLDPNYVYCLVGNNTDYGFKGLYLSIDGGLTFTLKSSTPNILGWNAAGNDAGGQAWYDLSIAVDPSVKTTIYTGGVNVWKSTTSGASWSCIGHWSGSGAPYVHADNHDMMFVGTSLWVANDGGVFTTSNGGSTWTDKSSNLPIAQMYGFGQSATNANILIGGHQDNGTNLTTNAGTSFSEVLGGDGMLCFIDKTNSNNAYASIYYGDLYRSTNGGASFSYIYTVPGGDWVTPWMQDPVAATTLYAGGTYVYRSTNSGTGWTALSSALSIGTILRLDVAPSNNQNIVASSSTRVIKSTNGGTSWTEITTGLPAGIAIQAVRFSPTDPNKIYVCLATYGGNSLYCSTDGGLTWASISTGLPAIPTNCLAFQSNGDMYCGTDLGVYYRSVGTTTWTAFTTGMPGVPVTQLDIFVPTGKLRASTYGRGLYESPLNSVNAPPSVTLTSPASGSNFSAPATITLAATASDQDGSITKVEFFNGTTLLGTSTVAPYGFTWSNVAAGTYSLTAKATDNSANTTSSTAATVTVSIQNDASITAIVAPTGSIATTSVTPSVTLKNFGSNTLTSAQILYRVDANANSTYNWTGSLAANASLNVTLPAITGYASGAHTFTATINTVNGTTDANTANNTATSSFTYSNCSNDNETANNSATTCPVIALNTAKSSQIGSSTDIDYYKFTTTTASPKIKVTLTNLPADYDLRLYKSKSSTNTAIGSQVAVSQLSGTSSESIVYNTPTAGGTYYVRVEGYAGAFSTAACYSLLVQTSGAAFAARGIELSEKIGTTDIIKVEQFSVYPNPAHDVINIRFISDETKEYNLTMINALGKTVRTMKLNYEEGENFTTLTTENTPQGIYFIKISDGKETFTQKVIFE
ncbi:MAG: T9SS type A sorting domain-containing protein [Saprospiraceae bacterium]|nr:T9SS type A sorting domain-containing protein [Saprospiraceae bacterium]